MDSWVPREAEEEPDGGMDTCDKTTNTGPDLIANPAKEGDGLKVGHFQPKLSLTQEKIMTEDTQERIRTPAELEMVPARECEMGVTPPTAVIPDDDLRDGTDDLEGVAEAPPEVTDDLEGVASKSGGTQPEGRAKRVKKAPDRFGDWI